MTMTADPMVGRSTDPETSTPGVKKLVGLKHMIMVAASSMSGEFTDTMLRDQIKYEFGKHLDRGVVARIRLRLERDNYLRRLPLLGDEQELRFKLNPKQVG